MPRPLHAVMMVCLAALAQSNLSVSGPTSPLEKYGSGGEDETNAFIQSHDQLAAVEQSFIEGKTIDLETYEKLVDDIDKTWLEKNTVYHAYLMRDACGPLSSGTFKDPRQYELARKYALSALAMPDKIPVILELELIGHVMTVTIGPDAPRGEHFAKRRKNDVAVRLHAWKRLLDAIDPNWDPDEFLWSKFVAPPASTGLPAGVAPEAIQDADLRKEYEAAIQHNRQMADHHMEQRKLSKWLKRFPRRCEEKIILAYSQPPFKVGELEILLNDFLPDKNTRLRIVDTVEKNIREGKELAPQY
ncbi:MAG: hypothetical protein ABFS42_06420 [Candidatus Krumholzibacteriota bacterium]